MDLWSEIGSIWDRASDGDPGAASADATSLANSTADDADRAVILGVRALSEIVGCSYLVATQTALDAAVLAAAATGPRAAEARYYTGAVRLVAAAMLEPDRAAAARELPLPELADIRGLAEEVDLDRPERLLLAYPAFEASMSSGDFAGVAQLIERFRPFIESDRDQSQLVLPLVMTQYARSAAFRGDLDALALQAAEILALPGIDRHPQLVMLTEALLCYAAGQRADRREVERLSRRVLEQAHGRPNYIAVGSCLLVTWAFSAIGQVQRAAVLLVTASGGAELPRIKTWDQAFGYELLVTAALRRGDIPAALEWAARAKPLGSVPVAAAAVERTLSRVAIAQGDPDDAAIRASASAQLDARSGAQLDGLRARVLYATALASSDKRELAIQTLSEIAAEADRLGASSVRKLAARQWRQLVRNDSPVEGGFSSLSDREREIAVLVAEGHTNRSIGSTLFLSERTVQTHLSRILSVLGLPSRTAIPRALGVGSSAMDAPALTQRQEQIARLVADGLSNAHIAKTLGISVKTVENHLAGIFARWQVSSRTAVANVYVARDRKSA
ncbi:MAG TPA: LuxR C-terminal-related transcriptional regulator [Galbitalea sp.]|jgi:DNA-binding NarL/FixJ family response regulator|nr:LuxR C-terminal-related transcriptional regulator [Galbitalea sp.]